MPKKAVQSWTEFSIKDVAAGETRWRLLGVAQSKCTWECLSVYVWVRAQKTGVKRTFAKIELLIHCETINVSDV
jgi:hypothetical protein